MPPGGPVKRGSASVGRPASARPRQRVPLDGPDGPSKNGDSQPPACRSRTPRQMHRRQRHVCRVANGSRPPARNGLRLRWTTASRSVAASDLRASGIVADATFTRSFKHTGGNATPSFGRCLVHRCSCFFSETPRSGTSATCLAAVHGIGTSYYRIFATACTHDVVENRKVGSQAPLNGLQQVRRLPNLFQPRLPILPHESWLAFLVQFFG